MKDKFSPEFLAKYQYRPTTNFVLNYLQSGADVLHALEVVLKNYEDHMDETLKEKILLGELGPPPQYIVAGEDVIAKLMNERVEKERAVLRGVSPLSTPFEDIKRARDYYSGRDVVSCCICGEPIEAGKIMACVDSQYYCTNHIPPAQSNQKTT